MEYLDDMKRGEKRKIIIIIKKELLKCPNRGPVLHVARTQASKWEDPKHLLVMNLACRAERFLQRYRLGLLGVSSSLTSMTANIHSPLETP